MPVKGRTNLSVTEDLKREMEALAIELRWSPTLLAERAFRVLVDIARQPPGKRILPKDVLLVQAALNEVRESLVEPSSAGAIGDELENRDIAEIQGGKPNGKAASPAKRSDGKAGGSRKE